MKTEQDQLRAYSEIANWKCARISGEAEVLFLLNTKFKVLKKYFNAETEQWVIKSEESETKHSKVGGRSRSRDHAVLPFW